MTSITKSGNVYLYWKIYDNTNVYSYNNGTIPIKAKILTDGNMIIFPLRIESDKFAITENIPLNIKKSNPSSLLTKKVIGGSEDNQIILEYINGRFEAADYTNLWIGLAAVFVVGGLSMWVLSNRKNRNRR